jgi:hypothetical protein
MEKNSGLDHSLQPKNIQEFLDSKPQMMHKTKATKQRKKPKRLSMKLLRSASIWQFIHMYQTITSLACLEA